MYGWQKKLVCQPLSDWSLSIPALEVLGFPRFFGNYGQRMLVGHIVDRQLSVSGISRDINSARSGDVARMSVLIC